MPPKAMLHRQSKLKNEALVGEHSLNSQGFLAGRTFLGVESGLPNEHYGRAAKTGTFQ